MRKIVMAILSLFLTTITYADGGIYQTYIILNINGGVNTFYAGGLNPDNVHPAFSTQTFDNPTSLILKGGEVKTFKNGATDITGAKLFYRFYKNGDSPGSFIEINLPFGMNLGGSGDQSWYNDSGNINLTQEITSSGTWKLECYWQITHNGMGIITPEYDSNNSMNFSASILPISLTHFSATPKADRIELNWATASEQNNDYMAVEKSAEGRRWEELGRVAGAGTTTLPQSYTLSDDKPLPGLNYYRLRQVDFDGRFEYHKTIAVDFKGGPSGSLHLFPSPAKDHLNVTLPAAAQQDSELWLLDAQGRVLQRRVVPQGGTQAVFEVSALPEGVYFVRMQGDVRSFRFVR